MKKIYISLPIMGYETTVRKRYDEAREILKKKYEEDIMFYGPTNIDDFSNEGLDPNAPVHTWEWHLGEDIKDLLKCDAIYMCDEWSKSRGCCLEYAVAQCEGIIILDKENLLMF